MMTTQATASESQQNFFTQRKHLFLLLLTLMSVAGLIGSDVYLPTLPTIASTLKQPMQAMQLTLSIYLFGLAIGQLIFGPLTDHFGRKKLIIAGMLLYFISSLGCALSSSYTQLVLWRFLQALGACSGLTIGRAIVGDQFEAKAAAKVFATIFPWVGMSPAISPVIGGLIGYYLGWQSTFIFVSLFALTVALLTLIYLPETLLPNQRQTIHWLKIIKQYPSLLINKTFIAYAAAPCTAYMAYFAYIAQSPFIFHAHGFDERAIGSFYISLSLTYVMGNLTGRRLLNNTDLDKVLYWGYMVFNLGGCLLLLTGIFNLPLWMVIIAISILTFGNGFLIPLGTAGVISSFNKTIGYASGLLGFLQLSTASLASSFIGILSKNSVLGLSLFIGFATVSGLILFSYFKNPLAKEGGK